MDKCPDKESIRQLETMYFGRHRWWKKSLYWLARMRRFCGRVPSRSFRSDFIVVSNIEIILDRMRWVNRLALLLAFLHVCFSMELILVQSSLAILMLCGLVQALSLRKIEIFQGLHQTGLSLPRLQWIIVLVASLGFPLVYLSFALRLVFAVECALVFMALQKLYMLKMWFFSQIQETGR